MNAEAQSKGPAGTLEGAVLDDPRWELLATGEATAEEVAELRAWAERSETARSAWNAFQPATKEKIDRLADRVLGSLDARHGESDHRAVHEVTICTSSEEPEVLASRLSRWLVFFSCERSADGVDPAHGTW